jgi:hypothetical protein
MTWQPIETAPRDGTPFLALCGWSVSTCRVEERAEKRETSVSGFWPFRKTVERVEPGGLFLEHISDGGHVTNVFHSRFGMPATHWMPLPPPPETTP